MGLGGGGGCLGEGKSAVKFVVVLLFDWLSSLKQIGGLKSNDCTIFTAMMKL